MEYKAAKEYIDGLGRFGSVLGLDNIKNLLKKLNNPQNALKVIHVAGTNGKGSTIAFLSSILSEAGLKVGKYTSPVVFEYREKYQIGNENISEEDFADLVLDVKRAVDDMLEEGMPQPTIFEVETAMAFLYFKKKVCDIVILETGMGGDMDATNVCDEVLVSVITSISLDHTMILGETLEEIATHKAGIIKKNCPVVVYEQSDEVMDVVNKCADALDSNVTIARTGEYTGEKFDYATACGYEYENLKLGLEGSWQRKNAIVALEVIDVLRKAGYNINEKNVRDGLKGTRWPGRFEKLCDMPLTIIDGAHNPGAARELKEAIDKLYPRKKFVYIVGVLADKDFSKVLEIMMGRGEAVITVTPNNTRALQGEELAKIAKKVAESANRKIHIEKADSVEKACELAIQKSREYGEDGGILAFGSLSYLSDVRDYFKALEK
ncbi:MAG: bifunctional folylpolyglutamate synthase/dihydrofolate synthase [Lachnospiraceae bacterium]|nr:bifunctional folylpolyglutamate synthase/dihydrofolate synthase [Lachnospiraceae bacterium]